LQECIALGLLLLLWNRDLFWLDKKDLVPTAMEELLRKIMMLVLYIQTRTFQRFMYLR